MERVVRFWRWIDQRPRLTDAVIAAIFVILALVEMHIGWEFDQPVAPWQAVALVLATMAPLAWRRQYPIAVLVVMTTALVVYRLVEIPAITWTANTWLLVLYGVGAYGRQRWRNLSRGVAVIVMTALYTFLLLTADREMFGSNRGLIIIVNLVSNWLFFGWVWWFGDVMRARTEREQLLAERTVQLENEREENARRAVLDERVRIARELHDVVAHHVSLMGVQAGAARRVLTRQPDKAEEALTAIEATSRQAVAEMHRLLGFLRREDELDSLAPQPSLRQLDHLIAQIRDAGLPVDLTIDGDVRSVPPSVDLSAYRIVQEALTNTLKHAGPARAVVNVHYGETGLDIEVMDDGRGSPSFSNGNGAHQGNGLVGMRERVGLIGGAFEAGFHAGVGFSVRAHLPIDRTER
jgi:signal transduction histidine kinase